MAVVNEPAHLTGSGECFGARTVNLAGRAADWSGEETADEYGSGQCGDSPVLHREKALEIGELERARDAGRRGYPARFSRRARSDQNSAAHGSTTSARAKASPWSEPSRTRSSAPAAAASSRASGAKTSLSPT